MQTQTLNLGGETFVVLPKADFDRLATLAKAADLPTMPTPDAKGNVPAVPYARASIAREIITRRGAAGWTQKQLAEAAGVRVETVCRIETGKHTADVATIEKLDRALKKAEKRTSSTKRLANKRSR